MARGKNTPALFEVIRNAQQKQKEQLERERQRQTQQALDDANGVSPAAQLLRSPIYWFKGKHAHDAAAALERPVMREVTPDPTDAPSTTVEFRPRPQPAVVPTPVEAPKAPPAVIAAPPVAPAAAVKPPVYTPVVRTAAAEAARQVREELSAQEGPAADPMFEARPYDPFEDTFDSGPAAAPAAAERPTGQININFNYTTAIISAFAVMVAFAVVFIIATAGRTSASKQPIAQQLAPRPDVLTVRTTPAAVTVETPAPAPMDDRANVVTGGDGVALEAIGKPIAVPANVKRVIGQQYLVLLSFPREEDAKDLVKYLAQNGVAATAEKALPDYAKSWTSVVTVHGFDHTRNNPAFQRYSTALTDLLQKYAGDSKFRKTFKIDVYTWRTAR